MDKPCKHAEFKAKRPCIDHKWLCMNQDCDMYEVCVNGHWCKNNCGDREQSGGE